jgi:hypothetical protein
MSDTQDVVDPNAAPDAATAAAAAALKEAQAAGKTTEQIEEAAAAVREEQAAALAKVKPKYYRSVHGGILIDPETQLQFNGENGVKSKMTSWLKFQIDNGKIAEEE